VADHEVVQSSAALSIGQPLSIRFAQGAVEASVTSKD